MSVDDNPENPFTLSPDELARLESIREALVDPSPRRIGRRNQ
ncbi:hypothetical protein [Streptomyces sp. NPDC053560]